MGPSGEDGEQTRTSVAPLEQSVRRGSDWTALGALGALVASVIYVLLNSAYREYYESLGVRPEDVGLDRLAILGRASGLALIALLIYGGIFVLLALSPLYRRIIWSDRLPLFLRWLNPSRRRRRSRWPLVLPLVAAGVTCVFAAFVVNVLTNAAGHRAELATAGVPVGPLSTGPLLLVDVSANAARAYWLDKDTPRPPLLDDPWLLYLGSNGRVVVFVACGTTVIVPADKVVPEVVTASGRRQVLRGSANARSSFCARFKS